MPLRHYRKKKLRENGSTDTESIDVFPLRFAADRLIGTAVAIAKLCCPIRGIWVFVCVWRSTSPILLKATKEGSPHNKRALSLPGSLSHFARQLDCNAGGNCDAFNALNKTMSVNSASQAEHLQHTHMHRESERGREKEKERALKWRQLWGNFMNFECTHKMKEAKGRQPASPARHNQETFSRQAGKAFCADTRPGGAQLLLLLQLQLLWLSLLSSYPLPALSTSDDYLETPKQLHYFYEAGGGALRWSRPLSGASSLARSKQQEQEQESQLEL